MREGRRRGCNRWRTQARTAARSVESSLAHPFSRRCVGRERRTRRPEFGRSAVTVAGPCRNRTGFAGDPRIQLCARVRLRGGDESLLGESRGVGEVRGEETLQGHDVRAEAMDLEVIAFADPLIAGEADGM